MSACGVTDSVLRAPVGEIQNCHNMSGTAPNLVDGVTGTAEGDGGTGDEDLVGYCQVSAPLGNLLQTVIYVRIIKSDICPSFV